MDGLDELPPPYTPSASTSTLMGASGPSSLTAHLQNLRAQADIARNVDDSRLLSHISDAVETLLTSVLARPRRQQTPLKVIEAVTVPVDAIGAGWMLSDAESDKGQSGKITRIVRISSKDEGKGARGDKKGSHYADDDDDASIRASLNKGFDDWGRWSDGEDDASGSGLALWWDDEAMARRLARFLQPPQAPSRSSDARPWSAAARMNEAISMAVRVEEATFRRENEMGLWESKTGWAIIVQFRL